MVLTFCAPRSIPRFLSLRKGRHLPTPQVCSLRMSIAAPASEEHFDVLHEDGTPKGYTKARSLVHRDGDWHRTTHIWVLSSDGRVLIQKRSADKDTFPVCTKRSFIHSRFLSLRFSTTIYLFFFSFLNIFVLNANLKLSVFSSSSFLSVWHGCKLLSWLW